MCVSTKKYPLVLDLKTEKKKVLFKCGINFNTRDEINKIPYYIDEFKKAEKGFSLIQSYNSIMYNKYKFIDLISVPCGICPECLKQRSAERAVRIMLESKLHQNNYFITLTYDDDNIPKDGMLIKNEISNFNKKLRTYLTRIGRSPNFRFYGVGEYGTKTLRPHYHVIYFGLDLPDDFTFYKENKNGDIMYNSEFLTNVRKKGFVVIGEVTPGSACYVAKYCDKKRQLTSQEKKRLYSLGVVPEFSVMSNRPGIGAQFLDYIKDRVLIDDNNRIELPNGQVAGVPMFYIKKIKEVMNEFDLYRFDKKRQLRADSKLYDLLNKSEYAHLQIDELNKYNSVLINKRKDTL